MRHPRFRRSPVLLLLALAGCSSTIGSKFGGNPQSRSIAVVGDRPLPATVGEPGGLVASETTEPEPRRNPKARISGRVLDEAGKPVPDATVRLADGNSKGGRDVRARTDRSGAFTLGGLRPGSSYWLIAELDDEKGPRTGRVRAKTAETGVEISLGDQGDGSDPGGEKPTRPGRARSISDREEVESESSSSRINEEDILPAADEAERSDPALDRKKSRTSGRPRLSAPEPAVGWRRRGEDDQVTRQARHEPDPLDPEETDGPRSEISSRRVGDGSEDEGPNPLPPAIDPGPTAAGADGAKSPRSRARRRAEPSDGDSGGLSLPPETGDDEEAEPPAPKPRSRKKPRAEPGPPPMPSVDSVMGPSVESTGVFAATTPSRLEPDPMTATADPTNPDGGLAQQVTASASGEAIALHDPPKAEGTPPPAVAPGPIASPNPAPEPVFASPAAPVPTPDIARAYNPFALVGQGEPEAAPPLVVATKAPAPEPPPAEEVPTTAPAPPTPPSKTKWGDVAPPSARPQAVASAAKPTSLFARLRTPAAPREPEKEPIPALCEFDLKTRKLVDFRLPDLEGKPVRFQELDADFILLDFWGTWCKPCLASIPHLIDLQKQYGPRKLKVVGIACEKAGTDQRGGRVDAFARRLGINYSVLLSSMDGSCPVQKAMQVRYYPTMILLDRKGQVVWSAEGATAANLERLDQALASLSPIETARR